jgi:WD40 repeat protein
MNNHARAAWALAALAALGPGLSAQEAKPRATFTVGAKNTWYASVTADGKTLVTLREDGAAVSLWDLATGKQHKAFTDLKPPAYTAAPSNDGKWLAVPGGPELKGSARPDKGGVVRVLDADTGKPRAELKEVVAPLIYVEFSPDGKYLAGGDKDGRVRVWDAASGEVKAVLKGHAKEVVAVAFSVDGKTLASGDAFEPGALRLWDWAAGKQTGTLKGHPGGVLTAEFTKDGKTLISAGLDSTVKVWDVASAKEKLLYRGDKDATPWGAISPSGRTAAWTTGRSPEAKEKKPDSATVHNLVTGKDLAKLKHPDAVLFVMFADEGRVLVSVSKDGTVQVWDVAALREKK